MTNLQAFATSADLATFWRTLSDDETARADKLLGISSNLLRQIARNNNQDIDAKISAQTDDVFADTVKNIVLASVKRAMNTPTDMPNDATSWSQTATPYAEEIKFAAPATDLFFKNNELKMLGLASVAGTSQFGILRIIPEKRQS